MSCQTPEGALEDGIFNRLTHRVNGITTEAGKYCHPQGGVQKWFGQVDLSVDSLVSWARTGVANGPIVLIVAGGTVEYDTDYRETAIGMYSVQLWIASANYREEYESAGGDAASAPSGPGIFVIKQDILDRILNHGIVKATYDVDGTETESWEDPPWVLSGRMVTLEQHVCLYELVLQAHIARIHGLTAYSALDDYEGTDVTLTKEPSTTGEEFQVVVKADT